MEDKVKYYNYDRIRSYNAFINMILTNRGYGKSYGAKEIAIRNFINKGQQFIYVRRYKSELKKIDKFFKDIKEKFPDHDLKVVGKTFYIDGIECGCAIPLSTSLTEKSTPYPEVTTVIFDEFIIDKGHLRYLENEVETFLELISTIVRKRNSCRVYLLANNISSVNPYFSYFDLHIDFSKRFNFDVDRGILVEISEDDVFMKSMEETVFGKLVQGTKYGDYAIRNKALRDSETFIEYIPLRYCKPYFNIYYKNVYYQVWIREHDYTFYVNTKRVSTTTCVALEMSDHENGIILNPSAFDITCCKELVKYFQMGKVRFINQSTKQSMYDIFKKLGVK